MKIKLLLVDDHDLFREGFIALIQKEENLVVIGEVSNGFDAIKSLKNEIPDMIILDAFMPGLNGIETAITIKKEYPGIRIIFLTAHSDQKSICAALKAGAEGYMLKNTNFEKLLNAIESVYNGKRYISEEILDIVLDGYAINSDSSSADIYISVCRNVKGMFCNCYLKDILQKKWPVFLMSVIKPLRHIEVTLKVN